MIFVLAYPVFDPSVAKRINAFRAQHEPERAKLVPPHITLVFGVDGAHLEKVRQLVDTAANQQRPIDVAFDRFEVDYDPFEEKHKLFLLCASGRHRLSDLHDQLYEGPHRADLSSEHPFKPHMTIASYDTRARVEAIDVATLGAVPIVATVSSLSLVRLVDGQLTELKTAPFAV